MNLSPVSKAIAGALATVILTYAARYGLTLDPATADAVNVLVFALVNAAIGFAVVYIAPKNVDTSPKK